MRARFTLRRSRRTSSKIVLARRSDGLGERLNALLNAIRLSDVLGVEFRFTWPLDHADETSHAIVPADEFFSADFLAAHGADHDATANGFDRPVGPANLEALRAQLSAAPLGLLAPNRGLARVVDKAAVPGIDRGYSAEFARIGLHPVIAAAIDAARDVPLDPDTVGIHLRAGDMLHGRFRTWNRFAHKLMSAPVARSLTEREIEAGHAVLAFGQDPELIADLCASTGAVDAVSMRPDADLPRSAQAMFELVLLSRCARIIGGNSGFSVFAASLGHKRLAYHSKLLSPSEVVALTRADMARHGSTYSARQAALAWWQAFHGARRELPAAEAAEIVSAALEADPSNPRYRLTLAALAYRDGDQARGDGVLADALIADAGTGDATLESVLLLSMKNTTGDYDSAEILDDIEGAAEAGSGVAALYRAALRATQGDASGVDADFATFDAHVRTDARLGALETLRAQARATLDERMSAPAVPGA